MFKDVDFLKKHGLSSQINKEIILMFIIQIHLQGTTIHFTGILFIYKSGFKIKNVYEDGEYQYFLWQLKGLSHEN